MRKGIVACAGMIVGLVLLLAGFFGPWYVIDATGLLGQDYHARLFLTKMELQAQGQDIYVSMGYAEAKSYAQNMNMNQESFTAIDTAFYLTAFALVTAILAVLFMAAFVFEKGTPKIMKITGGLCAFLTFLLTLLPALYFMNTEFVKESNGFWFDISILGLSVTGGPGYAWYLIIVVAILAVICAAAFFVKNVTPKVASVEKAMSPTKE
jgi:hypothetical protein